jgi:hypoxanthine phosphoribosyltransferase
MKLSKRPEKYEVPSWNDIYAMCLKVADLIKKGTYKPDLIIAVSRGGWIPGRILSDLLENPKIATIKVEYYEDIYETRSEPEITQPLTVDIRGKRVLLVDDIADSGHSLRLVKEHLFEKGAADVRVCTLYYKPWSVVIPDYSARITDAWVCFPHEIFETMRKVYSRLKKRGMTDKSAERYLLRMGIRSNLVRKFMSEVK